MRFIETWSLSWGSRYFHRFHMKYSDMFTIKPLIDYYAHWLIFHLSIFLLLSESSTGLILKILLGYLRYLKNKFEYMVFIILRCSSRRILTHGEFTIWLLKNSEVISVSIHFRIGLIYYLVTLFLSWSIHSRYSKKTFNWVANIN